MSEYLRRELEKLTKEVLISMYIETNHMLDLMAEASSGTAQLVYEVQACAEDGCEICKTAQGGY
jgi:hypothetical protein